MYWVLMQKRKKSYKKGRDSEKSLSTHHLGFYTFLEDLSIYFKKYWKNENKYGKLYHVKFLLHDIAKIRQEP